MNFRPKVNTEEHFNIRYRNVWEASKLYGEECYYIPSTDIVQDNIFKEITARKFSNVNKYLFFYTKDNDTFFNGTESFGGFGYLPIYSDIKYIAKKWFDDVSIEPLEGDLIYDVTEDIIFEITKVDENISEYSGDKIQDRVFNHKIYLELYKPNFNDNIKNDTMFEDIDLENLNDDLILEVDTRDTNTVDINNPFGVLSNDPVSTVNIDVWVDENGEAWVDENNNEWVA